MFMFPCNLKSGRCKFPRAKLLRKPQFIETKHEGNANSACNSGRSIDAKGSHCLFLGPKITKGSHSMCPNGGKLRSAHARPGGKHPVASQLHDQPTKPTGIIDDRICRIFNYWATSGRRYEQYQETAPVQGQTQNEGSLRFPPNIA